MNILDAQDKRQTALLSTGDRRPGYFRIGFIVLDIPPEDIVTTRVTNADEATPLRAKFPMFLKTGQSRWDVTIRWTAIANPTPDDTTDYSQWNDLQYVVAMFKASPFIEIENSHLRQVFFAIDPTMEHQRMAFGMRQLKVETSPDMVNALSCTLTMTYFNYYPYTLDFGYVGPNNDPVSAYQSQAFKDYLDTWITGNLNEPVPADTDDFPTGMNWLDQIQGTLRLKWRVYMPVPVDQTDPTKTPAPPTTAVPPAPTVTKPSRIPTPPVTTDSGRSLAMSSKVTPAFADKVASISSNLSIDPDWLMTVMNFETGGTFSPSIQNRAGSGAVGLIQFTGRTANGLGTSTSDLANMSAEDQLDYVYAYLQRYSGSMHNTGDVAMAVFAPVSVGKEDSFILYRAPSLAYSQNKGLDRTGKGYITRGDYVSSLGPAASNTTTQARVVPVSIITPAPTPVSDPSPANKNMSQQGLDKANADMAAQVSQLNTELGNRGWKLDYSTEKDAFFYQENDILLTDESHGDDENQFSLYPEGMTVLFVNNLAQIPLSSYQYPTYQHVGPATTLVSIAMKSNGLYREDVDMGDQEPTHPGIQSLSVMAHTLEDQFHRMKARWRSVVSIHRMQAVRVYNQFLNLLGVHSILLKDVNTATIPESPNAVSVQLTGAHYENFFEEVGEYLVKGLKNAYTKPFLDYLQNDIDKGLSADEKKGIFQLLKYRDAMKNHDLGTISKAIADNKIGTFPTVPMPIVLLPAEQALFKDLLQKGVAVSVTTDSEGDSTHQAIQLDYADYSNRVASGVSLTEFLLIYGLDRTHSQFDIDDQPVLDEVHDAISAVVARMQASPSSFGPAMDQEYTQLLSQASQKDPIFNQQMQLVVNDPKFRKAMASVGHPTGSPGEDNPGHGAYRDLGIRSLSANGEDLNPGSYFFDYSKETFKSIKDGISQVAADAVAANAQLNKPSSDAANVTDSDGIDNDLFLKAINAPETRMAAAFPTYKLFLLEEDNSGTFYAFDDFYSYSSVIDIEIIKFRDRPHLAKITMTNLANLLSHKLFDDTVMGKHEADLAKFNVKMPVTDSKGRVIASPTGSIIADAGEDLLGRNYIKLPGKTLSEGYGNGFNEIPLAYFPLQPGTKIEVRMGFSNNPDLLTRVFAGTVAEIEGDEILTITAQGFQAELMELAADKVGTDQFWSLSTLLHVGFKKGPRFGGVKIWGDAGDTGSIMKKVLEVSNAKHFGHWQLLKPDSPLMRGWPWQRSLGLALENLGSTTIGPLLQTGSDRTGQNILINHVINGDGTNTTNVRGKRTFFSQTPWWKFASWYSLDEDQDKERTVWDIIQDVSRRYPEYVLSVKDYGFPYGCDATMVFGHPRDSYYARPFNYDEGRNEKKLNDDAATEFKSWWTTRGRAITVAGLQAAHEVSPYFLRAVFATGIPSQGNSDSSFEAGKVGAASSEPDVINDIDSRGVTAFNDLFDHVAHSTGRQIGDFITTVLPNIFVDQGKFDQSLRELLAVQRQWQSYRNSVKPTTNALLQPIRKYHYIDHQTIINNGLVVNDQIFNAVRICNKVVPANQNIPPNHIRVLDCDSAIIRPSDNVDDQHLTNAYAESFLREEVGKMYRGDLILRGLPKIDPWDVLFITDPSTGITGPVVADKVIHSFNQEQGYITIVTPMVYISVNEAAGQEFIKRLAIGLANAHKLAWAGFNEFVQSDIIGQRAALLLPAAGALTAAGTVSAASGLASGIAAPVVSLIPAASATPPGWLAWAVLGALAIGGVSYVIARNTELNPILVSPLMRFGKPWIGGLEGYEISDFARLVHNEWRNFWIDEIEPTLLSFKIAKGYVDNTIL